MIYKTIGRIIANKIAKTLPKTIDSGQAAFIEDRCMVENMFLAQQLVRSYGRKNATPQCMLMVDIRKAFDTISWDFLENMLHDFRFPAHVTTMIMECVISPTYSISLNGSLHGFFLVREV